MANDFRNTDLVTKFAVKEFRNALMLAKKVDRQLDNSGAFTSKVGDTIRIRRPVMFTSTASSSIAIKDIEEASIQAILDERHHVAIRVTDEDLTLRIEDANERYIKPAMLELAQVVESAIAQLYDQIPLFTGTPGTSPGTLLDIGRANAALSQIGVPMDNRSAFFDSDAILNLVDGLKGVFPQEIAKTAIEQSAIGRYVNFDVFENQSLKIHQAGPQGGTPLVMGGGQSTTYLASKDTDSQTGFLIDGWTAAAALRLRKGDVLTFADVNSVNQRTREDTGQLAQFVVLADVSSDGSGNSSVEIAPPIIISGPYQTVTAAPVDGAEVLVLTGASDTKHRQNLAWHPNAISFFMARLDVPSAGVEAHRETFEGISILVTRQFDINESRTILRFDILFGVLVQNRRFAVRITS